MKEQIKIMMESAQYRLHIAEYNYGDNEDYSAYDKLRQLEYLVQALNEAYNAAETLENLK